MAARNPFFKPHYTEEEQQQCFAWFEQNMQRLPHNFLIDDAIATNDLPTTVQRLMLMVKNGSTTKRSTFSGYMAILISIKDKLEQRWTQEKS